MEDIEYGFPGTSGGRLFTEYIFSSLCSKEQKGAELVTGTVA